MPHDPSVVFIRCPSSVLRDRARSCPSHLATLTKVPAGLWIVRSYLAVIPYLRGRGMQWITIDPPSMRTNAAHAVFTHMIGY